MPTRNRAHHIAIHTPQDDAAKRITYCREAIIEDDAGHMVARALVQPDDLVVPFVPAIATTVRTVVDPVTGQSVTFSGAGLAAWIAQDYDERNAADITPAPAALAEEPQP